ADGDLDVYIANWSGADKLYANNGIGQLDLVQEITSIGSVTLDAEAADIDNDGDLDVVAALLQGREEIMFNLTANPDVLGASIPVVEALEDGVASAASRVVRAQVYDNAPIYITRYNRVEASYGVGSFDLGAAAAGNSGGQVFRAELPGNLVGSVRYQFRSFDAYGNVGSSAELSYLATAPSPFATPFGNGTAGSSGTPTLVALSAPIAGSSLALGSEDFGPGSLVAFYLASAALETPLVLPGPLEIWIGGTVLLEQVTTADSQGRALLSVTVPATLPPGFDFAAQAFGVELSGSASIVASPGLAITTL
ncbi:MAG: VCBS repeat-containing protein, partial [Planctomycetota bacterium]